MENYDHKKLSVLIKICFKHRNSNGVPNAASFSSLALLFEVI